MLSFNPSTPVKIFSKDMNDGGEIWGVEVRKLINHSLGKGSVVADSVKCKQSTIVFTYDFRTYIIDNR